MFAGQVLTSDQWFNYLNGINKYHVTIMVHPAGWNPHNLQFEWYEEKLTKDQYMERLNRSAISSERKSDRKKKGLANYEYHA